MSAVMEQRTEAFEEHFRDLLQTLNEGSVQVHFDPYEDIAWDSPEMRINPDDEGWILPDFDPLGATAWYQAQPRQRQIDIGRARLVCAVKVGLEFENLLIQGLMKHVLKLPNGSAEFRYCLHEMTEECNHIQMFQELVNRAGVDAPGLHPKFRPFTDPLMWFLGKQPTLLMIAILCGEEPIDHHQKALFRNGVQLPPAVARVMEIHIAEEARHISFATEWVRLNVPHLSRVRKAFVSMLFPIIMRIGANLMVPLPGTVARDLQIPREVMREAFFESPASKKTLGDFFGDMRALATEAGLMNRASRRLWKRLKIDGEPSRFRGEPVRDAVIG